MGAFYRPKTPNPKAVCNFYQSNQFQHYKMILILVDYKTLHWIDFSILYILDYCMFVLRIV